MFPHDVAVHLLQVGVKVLLSSRFGARWRGDEEKLLSLCLDVAVQKMLLVLQSAAGCCLAWRCAAGAAVQAVKCCRVLSKCCRMLSRSCRLLQKLQVTCMCCFGGWCRSHVCAARRGLLHREKVPCGLLFAGAV
jgi:hypothetical protein